MNLAVWGKRIGVVVAFELMFSIGFFVLMPSRSLGRIAEAQIEKAAGFQYNVTVQKASITGLPGLTAKDIELKSRMANDGRVAPGNMKIDRVKANAGLFSLLTKKPNAKVRVDMPSGNARVQLQHSKGERSLKLQFFDLSLIELGPLREKARMPLRGTLRGTIEATTNAQNQVTSATIDMNILGFILGPRTITGADLPPAVARIFTGEITLPALNAGDLVVRGTTNDEGELNFSEFIGSGDDLQLNGEGSLRIDKPFSQSLLDLQLSIAVDPQWVESAQIGSLISGLPAVAQAQQGDNLVFAVGGPIQKPSFAPAGSRRRVR